MEKIGPERDLSIPREAPVMPLPGALLFPHALLPLHIFEPRYRAMLAHSLNTDRVVCVALLKPNRSDWRNPEDFFHTSTVGLIRACVGREDGTSNLILQGLRRVRFREFSQEQPFPIARLEPLSSSRDATVETDALGSKVLELYERFKDSGRPFPEKVAQYLSDLTDPEMLADLMASTFIEDALRRQQVLEELSVNDRLRLVIQYLREETGGTTPD